ncbi:stimulated by retinoic acid gene 6 protein-like [Anguilla anguilla]|uniref:stimulated by retinoic acid gene 6 protein-like n=1 Tax=Anguilla anguilla TaxID=7936 RepID=UPI0015AE5F2F|nr:stimulated by retinoic acid gene 6 protein-like [Anguilla anguilla]
MDEMSMCRSFNGLHYWLIPAVLFACLSSLLRTRKNALNHTVPLRQRFSLPLPLKLLSTHSDRWSFAVAFGALFSMFLERLIGPEAVDCLYYEVPLWIIGLIQVLSALEISVVHYPIFTCLTQENSALANLLGFVYTLAWFIYQIVMTVSSPPDQRAVFPFSFQGNDNRRMRWYHILPSLLCTALLVLYFIFFFFKLMLLRQRGQPQEEEGRPIALAHHTEYVKRLLRPKVPEPPGKKNWFQRRLYKWDACFRFPARMLIMVAMALTGVYRIAFAERIADKLMAMTAYRDFTEFAVIYGLITAFTVLAIIIHICRIMVQYRVQMRRLYKGDRADLPRKLPATDVAVARSMSYIGLQLTFICLGMQILSVFISVVAFLIIFPFVVGTLIFFKEFAYILLAALPILLMAFLLRRLVVRRFFLQDKLDPNDTQKPLAFKNTQALENARYFTLSFFMIKGAIEFAAQLLIRIVLGGLNLARIDSTTNPSNQGGLLDTAYLTWVSVLMVDSAHTNPTALNFCHLLVQSSQPDPGVNTKLRTTARTAAGARRRWWLAYTLLRNPGLVVVRRQGVVLPVTPTAPPAAMIMLEP